MIEKVANFHPAHYLLGEILIGQLEDILRNREGRPVESQYDITIGLAVPFSRSDWYLESARFSADADDTSGEMTLVFGLRDSILNGSTLEIDPSIHEFMPCNLFGLVPLFAIISSNMINALDTVLLETRRTGTYVKLKFYARTTKRSHWSRRLARAVVRFMKKWSDYVSILERILDQDPLIGHWYINWRDLLSELSGLETSPHYPVLNEMEHTQAVEVVRNAAKGLLYSILSWDEISTPLVQQLITWLNDLTSLSESSDILGQPMEAI